jgi:hypothetical protein
MSSSDGCAPVPSEFGGDPELDVGKDRAGSDLDSLPCELADGGVVAGEILGVILPVEACRLDA